MSNDNKPVTQRELLLMGDQMLNLSAHAAQDRESAVELWKLLKHMVEENGVRRGIEIFKRETKPSPLHSPNGGRFIGGG